MAGHSKWANIKHRKQAQDAKKGQAYAKFCREIMIASKTGGSDPTGNFRLRTAIDRAKAAGLPNDTIDRVVAKGSGQMVVDNLENLVYEGYGPGGVAIYAQAMTDNRNRTAGDIRSYFNKYGGNLGETGCVGWMFKERGQVHLQSKTLDEEVILEAALESGAEDFHYNKDEDVYELWTSPEILNDVCKTLQDKKIPVVSAEITRIPQTVVRISDEQTAKSLLKLLDMIESHEDIQNVYANFEMEDSLFESLSFN